MVDVSSQNNSVSINVSSSGNSASIKASPDTAQYYSEKSREYATSDKLIDGKDYSSKYYANKSAISESNAKGYAQSSQDTYNQFQQSVDVVLSNVDTAVQGAVESINTKSVEAIDNINTTKTAILNDIEFVADGEKQEIEEIAENAKDDIKSTGFYMQDDKLYFINSKGEEEEFKSGGGGLEIGDIGIAPLGIDETKGKRRYLNGQVIIQEQYVSFTDKLKKAVELYPSLACSEDDWQTTATMTVGGQVGKFVIDDEAGTIRLPKIAGFIQGLTDLVSLGEIVEAGLPDHRHYTVTSTAGWNKIPVDTTHAISSADNIDNGWAAYNLCNGVGEADVARTSTASTFNAVYGNSNTVQPEAVRYPYFIQVATGAETEDNIINEIELNNPFSLLDYKYSEYELNNISWLRSEGQYNSKAIYPAVYDLLLKIYNGVETKAGVSVKLSTETFTDYDFVLNAAEETFRLPVKVKARMGSAVVGNGKALGINIGGSDGVLATAGQNSNPLHVRAYADVNAGTTLSGGTAVGQNIAVGVTTDPTKSGLEVSTEDLYLYFYVGETVQNAGLINAGRIEENFAGLVEVGGSIGMPSEKYIDLTLGADATIYTAPADGYYTLNMSSTGAQYMCMTNQSNLMQSYMLAPASGWRNSVWLPVKKGDQVNIGYNYPQANVNWFRFIYAEGSKWEAYQ